MKIQLDYTRIADTIYALAALQALETGAERVIGRNEEPALRQIIKRSLVSAALTLSPYVTALDPEQGTLELNPAPDNPTIHQTLEQAVVSLTCTDLTLPAPDPTPTLKRLRTLLLALPPAINPTTS